MYITLKSNCSLLTFSSSRGTETPPSGRWVGESLVGVHESGVTAGVGVLGDLTARAGDLGELRCQTTQGLDGGLAVLASGPMALGAGVPSRPHSCHLEFLPNEVGVHVHYLVQVDVGIFVLPLDAFELPAPSPPVRTDISTWPCLFLTLLDHTAVSVADP